jgi:hypothetical protein
MLNSMIKDSCLDTTDGSLVFKLDTLLKTEKIQLFLSLDPEINVSSSGNFLTIMLMDFMDNLLNNCQDTITLSLIYLYLKIIISWSHPHGIKLLDFGIWEPEFAKKDSLDTPEKSSLVVSPLITDKLSPLELTNPSNYGTLLLNVNSPVKPLTTLNGYHVLDIPRSSNPKV